MSKVTILVSDDKKDIESRLKRKEALKGTLLTSPAIQTRPDLMVEIQTLVSIGDDLAGRDAKVKKLAEEHAIAEADRDQTTSQYDTQHRVCVRLVEKYSTSPEEARGMGFLPLEKATNLLAIPLGIVAKYDDDQKMLRVRINMPPGMESAHLEISTNPTDEASWKRVKGQGLRRRLLGYPPGTYWLRARSVVAEDESEFCAAVSVVVR
jgi:hypothetical protein